MPTSFTITITDTGQSPDPLHCHLNDTIVWTNAALDTQTVTLPGCVTPQNGPVTLAAGASSSTYTVVKKGSYKYQHRKKATKIKGGPSGTIDVS